MFTGIASPPRSTNGGLGARHPKHERLWFLTRRRTRLRSPSLENCQAHPLSLAEELLRLAAGFESEASQPTQPYPVAADSPFASFTPLVVDLERHCPRARMNRKDVVELMLTVQPRTPPLRDSLSESGTAPR
jgi:hypothetical protein